MVREFVWTKQSTAFTGNDVHYGERGEAAVIDLPGGRPLFVLLNGNASDLIEMAVMDRKIHRASVAIQEADATRKLYTIPSRQCFEALNRSYPSFVTFADIADPASIRLVDLDDMAKAFGPDVALGRLTLQVTDDPVTVHIDTMLPWLEDLRRRQLGLNGKRNVAQLPGDIATIIGPGSFRKEGR